MASRRARNRRILREQFPTSDGRTSSIYLASPSMPKQHWVICRTIFRREVCRRSMAAPTVPMLRSWATTWRQALPSPATTTVPALSRQCPANNRCSPTPITHEQAFNARPTSHWCLLATAGLTNEFFRLGADRGRFRRRTVLRNELTFGGVTI
jgi:hypothetical protein